MVKTDFQDGTSNHPMIQAVEFFITYQEANWSLIELIEASNIHAFDIEKVLPKLIEIGFIEETIFPSGEKRYSLKENKIASKLSMLYDELHKTYKEIIRNNRIEVTVYETYN
jgi:hypothetical protein